MAEIERMKGSLADQRQNLESTRREFLRENAARLLRLIGQLCLKQGITDIAIPTDCAQLKEFGCVHRR